MTRKSGTVVTVEPRSGVFTPDVHMALLGVIARFIAWHEPQSGLSAEEMGSDTLSGFKIDANPGMLRPPFEMRMTISSCVRRSPIRERLGPRRPPWPSMRWQLMHPLS